MLVEVFVFDKVATLLTFRGLHSTLVNMVHPSFNLKNLLAILAWLRPQLTSLLMRSKRSFTRFKWTILAFYFHMRFSLVVFFVSFCHYLPALTALVIDSRTLDLVHAELAGLNLAFTVFTLLCFFSTFNHLNY